MSGPEPVRVLRIITRLNVGGPTRHVAILGEGLDPLRFRQCLAHGPPGEGEGPGVLACRGESVLVPDLVREPAPFKDFRARSALRRIIREFRPRIVHTHQGKAGALGRLAARAEGVPVILHTYHGHTFRGYFGRIRGAAVRWMERRAAAASDALVCQSPSQERDVLRHLGASAAGRTVIVPPAISAGFFEPRERSPELRRELGAADDDLAILLPARLVEVKRPSAAVRLLAGIRRTRPAVLWIAGEGPLRPSVEALAAEVGAGPYVRFLGNRADMPRLYAAADVTVLVSREEGTPLALLESMAVGTPVAAPAVGGIPDILGDDGIVLPADEAPSQWARRILDVIDDGSRRAALSARGRQRALDRHTPARLCARIASLYETLLGGDPPGSAGAPGSSRSEMKFRIDS